MRRKKVGYPLWGVWKRYRRGNIYVAKKRLESAAIKKGSKLRRNPKQPRNSVKKARAYSYKVKRRSCPFKGGRRPPILPQQYPNSK
jgi:hypothetical protein